MNDISGRVIQKMIAYFNSDLKRINHALKVYGFAKTIGELEGLAKETQRILEITAVLHDIGIKESERKYGSAQGKYQELEGPPVAMELLMEFHLPDQELFRIEYLIGHHHSYQHIEGLDYQILVEADFLVNIEEEGLLDNVATIRERYFRTKAGLGILNSLYI